MREVPTSVTAITADWLTDVLRHKGVLKSAVSSVQVEVIGAGVGLMGELGRLRLSYADAEDLPETMVVKCAAQTDNRAVAQLLDFYNREANFYNQVAPECPMRIPDSYYADVNDDTYDFVLLMQDLGDVSPRDQLVGAGEEEVLSAIEQIAGLHVPWWGATAETHGWMYPMMSEDEGVKLQTALYQPFVEPTLSNFASLVTEEHKRICRAVGEQYPSYWSHNLSPVDTFIHGDYRQDNLLYTDDRVDALVMDWQISGRGKPAFDIAYFMCQSVQSELRRDIEQEVLKLYVGRLKDKGIDYPLDHLTEDYRRLILGCLVYPVTVCGGLDLANERGKALAECMLSRNLQAIDDWGCASLLS